jgi:hypothetical protein
MIQRLVREETSCKVPYVDGKILAYFNGNQFRKLLATGKQDQVRDIHLGATICGM